MRSATASSARCSIRDGDAIIKKIGIVGGIAWPSTAAYYTGICRHAERRHVLLGGKGLAPIPEIVIESLDLRRAASYVGDDADETSWRRFDAYHREALQRVERDGAAIAAIASNTSHHRLPSIARDIGIPIVDLYDVTAAECARIGARYALILGTAATMTSMRLRDAFAAHGVDARAPCDAKVRARVEAVIADLQTGHARRAAARLDRIVEASLDFREARPVVCLACTELPLAFGHDERHATFERDGINYVDTARLHVDAIFDLAVA